MNREEEVQVMNREEEVQVSREEQEEVVRYKMYLLQSRLETYQSWPFEEGCGCTSEKMAEAGFLHTPSDNSPDVATCFFCQKELEGWEPEDDPAAEHLSHSPKCGFITLKKKVEDLSVEEFLKLEKERQKCIIKKVTDEAICKFQEGIKVGRMAISRSAASEP